MILHIELQTLKGGHVKDERSHFAFREREIVCV